jgi:hypothetical protein
MAVERRLGFEPVIARTRNSDTALKVEFPAQENSGFLK